MKEHDFFMVQFSYKHSREIIKPILAILHKINVHFFKKNSEILPVGVGLPEWSHSVSLISVPLTFLGGAHPRHVKVPRLGVESELQLLAYATATAMPDPSCVFNLCHSSWKLGSLTH